jgi:sulfur carrier protein
MKITLNGAQQDVPDGLTVLGLLRHLNIHHERVAVELNLGIVRKVDYGTMQIKDGDSVEVVSFMGGGMERVPPAGR